MQHKAKQKPSREKKTGRGVSQGAALRVFLVDDHAMLLDVMRRQFEADIAFEVAGAAGNLSDAYAAIESCRPDVVLLDIELGEESGLDAIGVLRRINPGLRVIMLSMFDQPICRDRAFELGADAYVTKGARFEALRALLLGEDADAGDMVRIWRRPTGNMQSSRLTLTQRELQVVQKLAAGEREKEVAGDLDISVSSVSTYLSRAMLKTGMSTRAELFHCARALGVDTAE